MRKLHYLFIVFLTLSIMACEEEDDLSKPTQTGANMMAAKINGQPWQISSCWTCIGGGSGLDAQYSDGYLRISGEQGAAGAFLSLEMQDVKGQGNYTLKDQVLSGEYGKNGTYARVYISQDSKHYQTTATHIGTITITKLDIRNKIISGTFSFKAQDQDTPNETIEVTEGWFDVKYK